MERSELSQRNTNLEASSKHVIPWINTFPRGDNPLKYHIPVANPVIGQEELKNVVEAVRGGWVSSKG